MTPSESSSPAPVAPSVQGLDRVKGLSYEAFIQDYVIPRKPAVLEDAISNWPALRKWTAEFWQDRYAERLVEIDGQTFRLSEVIDLALQSNDRKPAPYYRNIPLRWEFPELLSDILPCPVYSRPNWFHSALFRPIRNLIAGGGANYELFIGGAGRSFPYLHYDSPGAHTFIYQIMGRKKFILFAPEDRQYLYPKAETGFSISQIPDINQVDLEKFPLFAGATRIETEVGPGDTLFMPCGWWHTARMLSFSVGLGIDVANWSNWGHVMDYMSRKAKHKHPVLAIPYMAYMRTAGVILSMYSGPGRLSKPE